MSSSRILAAVLFAFLMVSGLNYLTYHERTAAILNAPPIAPTPIPDKQDPLFKGVNSPQVISNEDMREYEADMRTYDQALTVNINQLHREYNAMINREIVLVLLAGVGIILLWRRQH